MNEEEYENWVNRIKKILILDGESDEFIDFLISWFNQISGSDEMQLLQKYHPILKTKSEEEIYDFIHNARYFTDDMSIGEKKLQIFDSAFFLYRPCLKSLFNDVDSI